MESFFKVAGSKVWLLCKPVVGWVLVIFIILMLMKQFVQRFWKNRQTSNLVGKDKEHWFWGGAIKYNFSTLKGLQNSVTRCLNFPAMCSQWMGPLHMQVQVYHPDVIKTVLTKTSRKGFTYKFLKPILRNGLITSAGKQWKRHRRLLTPIFHFDLLKSHVGVFNKNSMPLVHQCEIFADSGRVFDISETMSNLTYCNMMECVMSQTSKDSESSATIIIQSLKKVSAYIFQRIVNPMLWNDNIYRLTKQGKEFNECCQRVHKECLKIIQKRRRLLESMTAEKEFEDSIVCEDKETGKTFTFRKQKGKLVDFLDVLLQTKDSSGAGLSDEEIMDEVVTFFSAGQEALANGMSYTLYYLASNTKYQQKCRDELEEVIGKTEEIDTNHLNQLTYLTQCLKESLRLKPLVHTISRELTEDLTVSHRFNDYKEVTLPAGSQVTVNIYALHRNIHVWNNPDIFSGNDFSLRFENITDQPVFDVHSPLCCVFDPERFSLENSAERSTFAFIPFSAGSRACIGQHFGMQQMKVVLAQVLRNYEFYRDAETEEPDIAPGVTLQSKNGVQLKLKRVQQDAGL